MLKCVLVLCIGLFSLTCAGTVPGLRSSETDETVKGLLFQAEGKPIPKPDLKCVEGKKCVVHFRLNGEVDSRSMEETIMWINAANEAGADAFLLEINSPGGSVPAGFEIIYAIENSRVPVTCLVDTEALSMGAGILESCQTRLMTKRALVMFHEVSLGALMQGTPNDWRAIADMLEAMNLALAEHNIARTNIGMDEYTARTKGGLMWFFGWENGLDYGVVDGVVTGAKEVMERLGR